MSIIPFFVNEGMFGSIKEGRCSIRTTLFFTPFFSMCSIFSWVLLRNGEGPTLFVMFIKYGRNDIILQAVKPRAILGDIRPDFSVSYENKYYKS